jgi:hypothetical protein
VAEPATGPARAGGAGPRRARWRRRAAGWSPTTRGLLWAAASGFIFSQLNALMRLLTLDLDPFLAQFLR